MTPELRQNDYIGTVRKNGAPGAIRTPGLLIRSPLLLRYFIFIFRKLALIIALKLIDGFWGSFRLRSIVCQNYARVKIPVDFAVVIFQYIYMKITTKHTELLQAIQKNPNATLRELRDAVDFNSTSTVDYYIKTLMLEGLLRKGNKWEIINQDAQTRT